MRLAGTTCLIVGLAAIAGCSRQDAVPCLPESRYSTARSAPPVQIPDDLSPPNEVDALRLPPETVVAAPLVAGECLEAPPSFFGDSSRSGASAPAAEDEPRRSRREARREARRETRGEAPATEPEAAPAEPREPASPGSDERVIDN